jgi:hypothetical protein
VVIEVPVIAPIADEVELLDAENWIFVVPTKSLGKTTGTDEALVVCPNGDNCELSIIVRIVPVPPVPAPRLIVAEPTWVILVAYAEPTAWPTSHGVVFWVFPG